MAFMDYMPQWGQNTQDVSGAPVDDTLMQLELKRKLALSDALRQQESPQGQMVSGHYVAPSWTQYLANAAGKIMGAKQEREAMNQYGQFQKSERERQAQALRQLGENISPTMGTQEGTFDIQVPSGRTPTPTDNLGGMQPYESGMKNISVPMTTQTGQMRSRTADEINKAIADYSATTRNPALLEKVVMGQVQSALSPKQTEWKEVGGRLVGFDVHGKPTGQVIGDGKPTDYGTTANTIAKGRFGKDFNQLTQQEQAKVVDEMGEIKRAQLGVSQANAANQAATTAYNVKPVETTYPSPRQNMPQVGQEVDGHVYVGGNPKDKNSWRKK